VRALFYDMVDGQLAPTTAEVSSEWKNSPADWAEGTEELVVNYKLPKAVASQDNRKYHGYLVRVDYKGEVQGASAEPAALLTDAPGIKAKGTGDVSFTGADDKVERKAVEPVPAVPKALPAVEMSGDSTRVENGVAIAEGRAVVKVKGTEITADVGTFDQKAGRMEFSGNVVLKQGTNTITGDNLTVEFDHEGQLRVGGNMHG
jgi:hypothetical protein